MVPRSIAANNPKSRPKLTAQLDRIGTSCAAMTGRQNQPVKPPVKVSEKQLQQ